MSAKDGWIHQIRNDPVGYWIQIPCASNVRSRINDARICVSEICECVLEQLGQENRQERCLFVPVPNLVKFPFLSLYPSMVMEPSSVSV